MSPFLFFSNEKRAQIQTEYPNMKITEVSAKLGEIWRDITDEEKAPYVEKSKSDRDRYKSQQSEFKGKNPQPLPVYLIRENNRLDKIQYTSCCIVTCFITMEYAYF